MGFQNPCYRPRMGRRPGCDVEVGPRSVVFSNHIKAGDLSADTYDELLEVSFEGAEGIDNFEVNAWEGKIKDEIWKSKGFFCNYMEKVACDMPSDYQRGICPCPVQKEVNPLEEDKEDKEMEKEDNVFNYFLLVWNFIF